MGEYVIAGIRTYIGAEVTPGVSVAPVGEIKNTAMPDLEEIPTNIPDGSLNGKTPGGLTLVQSLVQGSLSPVIYHDDRPSDIALAFFLGNKMAAPVGFGAGFRFWYTGAEESAKITINNAGNYITSYIGPLGAEIADTNFQSGATPGEISFADITADTIGEAVALINGLADYSAVKIAGPDSYNISTNAVLEIGRVVQQGKNAWVDVWFTGTTAYIKYVSLPNEAEALKTLSVQLEGRNPTASRYTGVTPLSATLSGAVGAIVTLTGTVHGFQKEDNPTPASVPPSPRGTYKFWNRMFYVNGEAFLCVRNISVTVNSNTLPEYCAPGANANGNLRGQYNVDVTFGIQEGAAGEALKAATLTNAYSQFYWLLYGGDIDIDTKSMVILKGWGQFTTAPNTANGNIVDRTPTMAMSDQTDNYNEEWEVYIITTDNNLW